MCVFSFLVMARPVCNRPKPLPLPFLFSGLLFPAFFKHTLLLLASSQPRAHILPLLTFGSSSFFLVLDRQVFCMSLSLHLDDNGLALLRAHAPRSPLCFLLLCTRQLPCLLVCFFSAPLRWSSFICFLLSPVTCALYMPLYQLLFQLHFFNLSES